MKTKLALLIVSALAADLALAADPPLHVPTGQRYSLGTPHSGSRIYAVSHPNRSYCCTVLNSTSSGLPAFSEVLGLAAISQQSVAARGLSGNATGPLLTAARRHCWYHAPSESAVSEVRLIVSQPQNAAPVDMLCEETTLVGGFNTSVTDFNFLEISATAETGAPAETISGVVIIDTTIRQEQIVVPFLLQFGGDTMIRHDFSIRDLIGGHADFGQVRVIHNAAPGVVKARVSQYKIVSQQPLDFVPVLQEVLVRRVAR